MTNQFRFEKATRKRVKLRMAIAGPSGSGKTYTALALASVLGDRVALIDTEHDSASLYADQFEFDTLSLGPPFSPERFIEAMRAAEGYDVLVIDSLSHEWNGEGGVLQLKDEVAQLRYQGNGWAAWNELTPRHTAFLESIIRVPAHVIGTLRSKTAYVQTEKDGRKRIEKMGMEPIQRDLLEYEFSIFGEMDLSHKLAIAKSRYVALQDKVIHKPGDEFARELLKEIEQGEEVPDEEWEQEAPAEPDPEPSASSTSSGSGLSSPKGCKHTLGEKNERGFAICSKCGHAEKVQ